MYLTQHTDYGLRVLIYAAINDDSLVNIGTIAEAYNISKSHLMKVVTALVKGGFLTRCMGENNECLITPSCRLTGILGGAIKAFFAHLDGFTLQDLLNKPTYDLLYEPKIEIVVEKTDDKSA